MTADITACLLADGNVPEKVENLMQTITGTMF